MLVNVDQTYFSSSPGTYRSTYPLYKLRLLALDATATGTSTANSSVSISLVRNGISVNLLSIQTSSTDLTVSQSVEFYNPGSGAVTAELGNLTGNGIILSDSSQSNGYLEITWVNNGSYAFNILFEEFV